MPNNRIEFLFLKLSIEQFLKDLRNIEKAMKNKVFTENELLEIMSYLLVIKENIESLEEKFLEPVFKLKIEE
jgi:hypothetical protein